MTVYRLRHTVRWLAAMLVLLSLSSAALAQDEGFYQTGGHTNGRWWMEATEKNRFMWLGGMMEAMDTAVSESRSKETTAWAEQFVCRCVVGEVAEAITLFYEEPVNRVIPVVIALRIHVMKARGRSAEDVQAEIRRVLSILNAHPPTSQ